MLFRSDAATHAKDARRGLAVAGLLVVSCVSTGCKKDVSCGTRNAPKPAVAVTSPWKEATPALTSTAGLLTCESDVRHVEGVGAAPATWSASGEAIVAQLKSQGWTDDPYAIDGIPIKREKDAIHFSLKKADQRLCGYVASLQSSHFKGDAFHFHYGTYDSAKGHCMEWTGI